ncbi:SDR family oxidoreductase [Ketogulonicigenium vulgare]|uniref:Short-chain alcohol dehydrogenase-like protein dehydrogenase n=1 Tax=Ketogulonicigenium vulgare (strain WSH-001) TaxID=759362 RepID=F9Y3N0_KETVW|nr:SDR family oxidoreductase [Ketogulonicigenium vulgare]ADO42190.1 short-chain dehydrogenase/reductase SDR [Ketogulonicigenium vulgare Y25]AEM40394.1 short-chain alcohol dehydrogenase-like protein dehydrogenase [Ketogulonicigenium vulgare WSH-001]ALJ80581.1 short-chain dehydrogenase [Ketogulonicigenium vulgare]ANW33400.1 short-chain dehydrogenase [Ketogulonicigenium vulgare]AOZ54107.1 short-chain dehydrogenase/reductase SDR [Ketogulonicigenium vulgare]
MKLLEGKVALVTGAVGGIGTAIVRDFLAEGAKVILMDIKAEAVEAAVAKLQAEGFEVAGAAADIRDAAAVKSAVDAARAKLGPISIVVANANTGGSTTTMDKSTPDVFRTEVADNVGGQFNTIYAAIDDLKALGGSITVVGSVNGLATFGQPGYSAAKSALVSLVRTMATEYGPHNIRANMIAPGTVRTPAWDSRLARKPDVMDGLKRWYPLGRVASPEDIAKPITFLASEGAAFISGAIIPVDGGLMAGNHQMAKELTLEG